VTLRQRVRFYQQLAVLTRAGVTLRSSLQRLRDRLRGRQLALLEEQITAGATISDAFLHAGFSPFECHLVHAGERSARLEIVYEHLADFWDRQRRMLQAIVGQVYYPLVVLHLAIFMGAFVQFVLGTTVIAIVGSLMVSLGLLYGIALLLFLFVRWSWPTDLAQRIWLRVPLIGGTLATAYAYRWVTALRIEYTAGIPLPDAVADAWRASGFPSGDRLAAEGELALREGGELAPLVQQWRRLPRDWVDFIETGEISGALDTALENLDAEAGRAWLVAQQRMSDWLPKILYFIVLLIAAVQVFALLYKVTVAPLNDLTKQIDAIGN
jgi:type II secretory pathway component PulF